MSPTTWRNWAGNQQATAQRVVTPRTADVVTAITWQTVPAFLLRAEEAPMRWNEVLSRLDELAARNEHFEFYWFPHTEGCLTKRNNRVTGPARPLPRWRYLLDDEL